MLHSHVNQTKYTYFIWLNSSVRGPFLPSYIRRHLHWTRPFTSKISRTTKLVGATINCGGAQGYGPEPHVQSYVVATDQIGLKVLEATPGVFGCWETIGDVVVHSEIGSSRAILKAGFNIDCLMTRYQGLDWRSPALHSADAPCNAGLNPLQPGFNDNVDVHPLEVMFVKVKESLLSAGWRHSVAGVAYERWFRAADAGGDTAIQAATENAWLVESVDQLLADAHRRGEDCFDVQFYINSNAYDLSFLRALRNPKPQAWKQFIEMGIYEGRPHRWTC